MLKTVLASRRQWQGYAIVIVILHLLGIWGLISAASVNPAFWGLGLLAYTFGLRHAFDVDHIAAIDNTVRKLVEQKRNPLGLGFFFSLGHSTVVFLMVLAIAFSVHWIQNHMPEMQDIGGVIGASVSGLFLLIIGLVNLVILVQLFKVFQQWRRGEHNHEHVEHLLHNRGFFARLIRPFYGFIKKSWHVYPLGFLFGLGFDTATEVGLLAISAGAAKTSISVFGIISLPLLFAAGMSLLDTADGMVMTSAYRWAFKTPLRKLYYNLTVTLLSVIAALLIGMVELTQVLSEKLDAQAPFFKWLQDLDFGVLGYVLVALFLAAWAISLLAWKWLKVEKPAGGIGMKQG